MPSDTAYDPNIHLSRKDVAVDNPNKPTVLRVSIKQSKNLIITGLSSLALESQQHVNSTSHTPNTRSLADCQTIALLIVSSCRTYSYFIIFSFITPEYLPPAVSNS